MPGCSSCELAHVQCTQEESFNGNIHLICFICDYFLFHIQLVSDKSQERRLGMEILNALQRGDGKRAQWRLQRVGTKYGSAVVCVGCVGCVCVWCVWVWVCLCVNQSVCTICVSAYIHI